jgi:hypothetical protein
MEQTPLSRCSCRVRLCCGEACLVLFTGAQFYLLGSNTKSLLLLVTGLELRINSLVLLWCLALQQVQSIDWTVLLPVKRLYDAKEPKRRSLERSGLVLSVCTNCSS